jgi:hypothetical protein
MSNNGQTIVQFRLPRPGAVIKTAARSIRKCLLRRHLWHPISTAPHNQDLELRLVDENALVRASFPCRRTNSGGWINADLGTSLQIQPITRPENSAGAAARWMSHDATHSK